MGHHIQTIYKFALEKERMFGYYDYAGKKADITKLDLIGGIKEVVDLEPYQNIVPDKARQKYNQLIADGMDPIYANYPESFHRKPSQIRTIRFL